MATIRKTPFHVEVIFEGGIAMTLEEQIAVLQKAQSHYEHDCRKEEAMGNYTPVEKNEYASKGVAGSGLGLGIAGTALGLLNNGGLNGLFGNNRCGCNCQEQFVTRKEFELGQQLAAKDSEIGLLRADKYTDQKIVETYQNLQAQINALKENQYAVNLQQATLNATQTATITCMQQQIAQLQSLTKMVVPNTSVCPGWGNVTITPAAATTTAA